MKKTTHLPELERIVAVIVPTLRTQFTTMSIAQAGCFRVALAGDQEARLSALFYCPDDSRARLVRLNLWFHPVTHSSTECVWSGSYEELGELYRGSSVQVLGAGEVQEFHEAFEEMPQRLLDVLNAGTLDDQDAGKLFSALC
ncbi:MAG: hypothetical protein KDD69_06560 [Bdellovibrionales bacterium]|nr:hypothetical protein [Bdellovibrionales bacterium]